MALYSSQRADALPGTATAAAAVSSDEAGWGLDRTGQHRQQRGKRRVRGSRVCSGRGLDQTQVGSRYEPTLGQQASKESQTLTRLSTGSHRLETFVWERGNCRV